ncbi:MAG TPA: D-alanine--D-alanine ligase family protein [Acidimicrobiales bacterium]|nr:D-alanine--D-alanine ligase family protein [Acidimicrobiales bacterium]
MPDQPRTRLVVLFGGVSAERDVSCVSAAHVLAAVDPERFDVVPVGIDPGGRWVLAEEAKALLDSGRGSEIGSTVAVAGTELEPLPAVRPTEPGQQVVVLPLVHGPLGEDGTVQGMLELAGVPYVGSGVLGSALCMDKVAAKAAAAAAGLPQARHLACRDVDAGPAFLRQVVEELGLPAFVKPANLGSSVGVSRAADPDALAGAVADALRYDEWVVVEEAITGREVELGVLGNAEPRVSVPGEIVPTHEFYDYEDKYVDGAADLIVPADLPPEVTRQAQDLALRAYRALRCDGYARVDLFWEEGGRGLLLNEINTIPGFTPYSMFPSLWAASGLAYPDLIAEMVHLGLERHAHRAGFGRPQPA